MHKPVTEYLDGLGESGLAQLVALHQELLAHGDETYWLVWRVPLAASDDAQRTFKGRQLDAPTWRGLRAEHGPGRYEVVLMGPPEDRQLDGWRGWVRARALELAPWLAPTTLVPRGRAAAAMFDTVEWNLPRAPMPQPRAIEQPCLFNPEDVTAPYAVGSDTSMLAAEAIAPHIGRLHRKVLEAVKDCGAMGATCDETEERLALVHQTCSARFNELSRPDPESGRPQLLFDSGARRKTRQGQLAVVWLHRDVLFG